MNNNDNKNLNETSQKRSHHRHRHTKHIKTPKKLTFKEKIKSLWKKFLKKLGGEGTKKETSMLLAVVIIMVITVPIVIAFLDFINRVLMSY